MSFKGLNVNATKAAKHNKILLKKEERKREERHLHGPLMGMGKDSDSAVETLDFTRLLATM